VTKVQPPSPPYVGPAAHTSAGSNQPIRRIVIHSTVSPCKAGGARATAAYFRSRGSGGSAHYVVDPSEAVQVVWDNTIAWHAPPNAGSIGVELCDEPAGPNGGKASVSRWADAEHAAMLDRAAELVAQLCLAYDVPIRKVGPKQLLAGAHGICGHVDVSQAWHESDHWDPGHFPWQRFIALVKEKAAALEAAPPATRKPARKKPAAKKPAQHPAPVHRPKQEQAAIDATEAVIHNAKSPRRKRRFRNALAWLTGRKH